MDIATLTGFFMWCSILNAGLLLFTFLMLACAGDFVYRTHTRFFPMPRETFNAILYSFIGLYKIMIFVFCLAPWVALLIVG